MTLAELYVITPKAQYPKTELIDEILRCCEEAYGDGCIKRESVLGWCNGRKPSDSKFLPCIAKATGIKVEHLFKD